MAADVFCPDGMTTEDLAQEAEKIPAFKQGGIGIYPSWVHLDIRTTGKEMWRMTELKKNASVVSENEMNGPLKFELLPNGRCAKLIKEYKIRIACSCTITVHAGFVTDFASVPRMFWLILPPWGRYAPAAVVHDFLYYTGHLPRAKADRIFLVLMAKRGVPAWKRYLIYWAVRLGGSKAWNDSRGSQIC